MAYVHELDPSAILGLKQVKEAQFFDIVTAKEWFNLIEDGVPEDVALKRLEEEVYSAYSHEDYQGCYEESDSGETFGTLTVAEYKVILMYCTEGCQFYLRLNEDCRKRLWNKYIVYTSLLHSVCMKLRNMPMEECVQKNPMYRGLRSKSFGISATEFCWPGFTSATTNRGIAEKFGDTIIDLQSETGAPVRRFSEFFEYEILFSPFFVFKVERKRTSIVYRGLSNRSNFFLSFPYYRGALLGAAVGNCLGLPFELQPSPSIDALVKFLDDPQKKGTLMYGCDTSTSFALAKSLTEKNGLDIKNFRDSLVSEFYNDPSRNYGGSMVAILQELKNQGPKDDPFAPAQRQFDGSGSHGNGGAMRATPAALFFYNLSDYQFKDRVREITRLTHAHVDGINGAILQATAVRLALRLALEGTWEKDRREEFVSQLLGIMYQTERRSFLCRLFSFFSQGVYTEKLKIIQGYLKTVPTLEKVRSDLGTGMSAVESVPAAIYCFLRGLQPTKEIPEKYNGFERTIIYAISLGGDTDTIASMAGAIAGAYYGQDAVTQRWRDLCETKAIDDAKRYAKQIHSLVWN